MRSWKATIYTLDYEGFLTLERMFSDELWLSNRAIRDIASLTERNSSIFSITSNSCF